MKVLHTLVAFNRGLVSRLALARMDVKRLALSAEVMTNWVCRVMGSMMFRPGLAFLSSTRNDAAARHLGFVYATDDTAIIELTDSVMRVRIDDTIVRRPAVTSKLDRWNSGTSAWVASSDTTSGFGDATDVGYWKDNDESGGTSALYSTAGYLSLTGNGTASAIRDRRVAVIETNVEHSIGIVVNRGTVMCKIGSTEGGEDLFSEHTLRAGYHSISVTPTGVNFFIRLSNSRTFASLVDSVTLGQAAADMELTTPWTADDLPNIRKDQSGDVLFVACRGRPQKRIERQGSDSPRSWSVVEYAPEDGPFRDLNTGPVRLKGSALTGDIDLTAERAYFKSTNVGSLFALVSAGQTVNKELNAADTFSDPIRVTGISTGRSIQVTLAGTYASGSTVTLQRSPAAPGDWVDVLTWTGPVDGPYSDGLDNQIIYYRLGIKTGNYTAPDDIDATLSFSAGSITGIVRATEFTSSTVMKASVLSALGKADQYTQDWSEGDWSDRRGYPSAVAFNDGRLFWAGKGLEWGSVPDQFDSFDDSIEGDSAPIRRTLGQGPIDNVNWLASGANLMFGLEGNVSVARSSALDEPLTQVKFRLTPIGDTGTAAIQAERVDTSFVYVGRNARQVFELSFDGAQYAPPSNLTAICPEIGGDGFVRIGFQFFPDRRLHFVRQDGTVAILVLDKLENVNAWLEIETDGEIEDVVVLPGEVGSEEEDRVYYTVKRTINGSTKRYLEKWATEAQAQGAADSRIADCHVTYTGAYTTLTGLDHIEGEEVVLWRDGVCPEDADGNPLTFTVSGGAIMPDEPVEAFACVGLSYQGPWKSSKLAVASRMEAPLTQRKQLQTLGLVLADCHPKGLKYGQRLSTEDAGAVMDDLPQVDRGAILDTDEIISDRDYDSFTVPGEWSTDARLCLLAQAPRPVTILAAVLGVEGNDK